MREAKLPSGATLKVSASAFAVSKALYQAVLREMRTIPVMSKFDVGNMAKDFLCIGFSSPEIEACIWECMKRCTYNAGKGDLKIDGDTFEPVETRGDYVQVCLEVAQENIAPFVKSLYAEFNRLYSMAESTR